MVSPVEVMIVDDAPGTLDKLKRLLAFEDDIKVVGEASDAETGIEEAKRLNPSVIVMDVNLPGVDGIQATELLSSQLPLVPVVIISVQNDREYLRRAMQAGAREYLVKPFSGDELVAAIRRVNELESLKRTHAPTGTANGNGNGATASDGTAATALPVANPQPAVEPVPQGEDLLAAQTGPVDDTVFPGLEEKSGGGRIIAVYSGKGGVGKSTISINLAAAIADATGEEVALVDLDLQFGDIAILLGMHVKGSFADIAAAFPNIDGFFVGGLMPLVEGGMRVLPAPLSPELADLVAAEHVRSTLDILAASFANVVVDTSSHLNDIGLEALDRADKIVVVTTLSISAIKETKLAFKLFDDLRIPRNRITIVVNQADGPWNVTIQQLESTLGRGAEFKLPNQPKHVLQSISKGLPFTRVFPEAEISQRVGELARALTNARQQRAQPAAAATRRRGWL